MLSDDCVVAVQGGSGPTMTPPWLREIYFRLQDSRNSQTAAATPTESQYAIQRQSQCSEQAEAYCFSEEGPEEECNQQSDKESQREDEQLSSLSHKWTPCADFKEESEKIREGKESCESPSN